MWYTRTRAVILGDLNCDVLDGDGHDVGRLQIESNAGPVFGHMPREEADRRRASPLPEPGGPESAGAVEAAEAQGGANATHRAEPRFDTADFPDEMPNGPGNLRVDYVIPSLDLKLIDMGVFWPASDDPLHRLVKDNLSSDHRLVWVDVKVPR